MTKHTAFTEGYTQDKTGTQNTRQTEKPKKHLGQRNSAGPGGWGAGGAMQGQFGFDDRSLTIFPRIPGKESHSRVHCNIGPSRIRVLCTAQIDYIIMQIHSRKQERVSLGYNDLAVKKLH